MVEFKSFVYVAAFSALMACNLSTTNSPSDDVGMAQAARANYLPSNMLLGSSRNTSSPLCRLSFYSSFLPVTDFKISRVGVDHEIEWTVPRHFTGLGIAAINDLTAKAQLRSELLTHARAGSMINLDEDISVNRMIQPVIIAYGHNRDAFTAEERQEIEEWLSRIVDGVERDQRTRSLPQLHNIRYRNALNQMMLGIVSNDDRRVQRAIRTYKRAINGLRSDGSFPNDSERGGSSLNYQAGSTASLVTIAELAAGQGIDLYSYGGEKTISTAVNFTLDVTVNPALIFPYARRSNELWMDKAEYPARTPYAGWKEISNAEWVFYWITRFPNSPETTKIMSTVEYAQRKQSNSVNPDWDHNWRVSGSAACFTSG